MKQRFSKQDRERLSEMTRALYEQFYAPAMKRATRAQREESAILAVIREREACQEKNEKNDPRKPRYSWDLRRTWVPVAVRLPKGVLYWGHGRPPTVNTTIHPFEEAGLGNAPFRVVGMYQKWYQPVPEVPRRPGGTCDLCGNSIANCFQILSSDGKRHIVGSECVQKTADKFIINQARITARRAERARLIEELKTVLDENFEAISNLPCPDYAHWTWTNPPDWFAPRDRNGIPRVFFGRFGTYGGEYVSGLEVCSRTFNEIYNYATWLRAILPPTKRERSLAELKRVRKYLVENGIIPKEATHA